MSMRDLFWLLFDDRFCASSTVSWSASALTKLNVQRRAKTTKDHMSGLLTAQGMKGECGQRV